MIFDADAISFSFADITLTFSRQPLIHWLLILFSDAIDAIVLIDYAAIIFADISLRHWLAITLISYYLLILNRDAIAFIADISQIAEDISIDF